MSLRARMGLAAGGAVALAVLAVAVSAYLGTRSQLQTQIDTSLQGITHSVLSPGGGGPGGPGGPDGAGGPPGAGTPPFGEGPGVADEGLGLDQRSAPAFGGAAGTVTLFYADGGSYVPAGQRSRIPSDPAIRSIASSGRGSLLSDMRVGGNHIRVLVTGIGRDGALAVALPLSGVDSTLSHELLLMALIAVAGIGLAALLGLLVARTAVRPITRFTQQTERIAVNPERLEDERLAVSGDDELARLARTFNTTLDALERSVLAQRNLVADASHELRTPIASLRGNLQLLRDESRLAPPDRDALRADMIEELDELTRLVGDVVELARGTKPPAESGDVRLDQIVSELVERARRRVPELRFGLVSEPTLVRGDGERISRAVSNLLDNAAKWSPPDGTVDVELSDGTVTVRDHGPGFREADLPFVFDRFHRAPGARSKPGSGLGLAIVRQAAEAHGGFAEAANAPGGGAMVRVGFGPSVITPDAPSATMTV